jgi:hypothetical protein
MSEAHPQAQAVPSPFAHHQAQVSHRSGGPGGKIILWVAVGFLAALLVGFGAVQLQSVLNDPFRTLQEFPADRYFENYQALAGARYKADLRVENELGFKEGVGKLMVLGTQNSRYSLPVLVSPELASTNFTKGQLYRFELIVREGGVIYGIRAKKL